MFEKEARERAEKLEEKQTLGIYDNDEDLARDEGFNEGQVVGYEEGFNDGAEFGYNKANEWHYVKDEKDLPTDKTEYLLSLENGIRTFGFYNGMFWESWKGDFSWQEVKAYFFVPVQELKESE